MRHLIGTLAVLCLALTATPVLAASTLTDLDFRQGERGELLIDLSFRGGVPEVRGYRLDEPARLTIDLVDTANALERRRLDLGIGGVEQVTALEAGSRTRLVFHMDRPLPYDTVQQGDQLRLTIGGPATAPSTAAARPEPAAAPQTSAPASAAPSGMPSIADIDFRRGEGGAGRLIVTFDRGGVDARVRESGRNRIVAELSGVDLPEAHNQVLDVSDFGTPLRRITPRVGRDGVTLEIEGSGEFAMLSTQSGRQLTIEAQPVTQQEREQRIRQQFPYTGERITLNFQDIEVRSVLAIIADFTGLNLVASDSVTGQVTLNLQDVPWDQALDLVLKSHGLASRQEGNVIMVAPASELANIERQELEARAQVETLAPLVSEYVQVRYARAEDLAQLLRGGDGFGLLTERGRVAVDQRTNTLLIQDTADQIQEILRTLDQLDVAVRQVQIEARIVIARDGVTQELGVNWGASSRGSSRLNLGGASSGVPTAVTGDGFTGQRDSRGQFTGEFDTPSGSRFQRGGLAVDLGSANPMTSFGFGYLSGDILLDLELRALESENKSQTISQPRVITANQRTAIIQQGEERAFQTISDRGTETDFKEALLSLEVTPQITPDNRIIMDLVITNDSFREALPGQAPPIDTNRIETQVLVDNGETVVLGGILTTEQLSRLAKTPFFGDLPVLGRLFRYNESSNQKVELLVFITPRILEDGLAIR
ncbi:type IV pilus secretin PilQ [Halomonas desiderata]|uniref:Type IV pilus secretin PilQ n=1 Tax=Billgrantia desiderata TaxID=52021 RepID=A0AAW4YQN4_9GAMM|nr:type IV pilus secretin PilQ [Halomonas desiderata]MCE8050579.1 type IV pilus secretin PilQ [Halomonas desiderata]NIC39116.1 type IV pilus secretin PilQ [Halomonas desiderata]